MEERNKRQMAVRTMLDEQLEDKRRRKTQDELRKDLEDRLEEERLERQRRELDDEYRREVLSREGLGNSPPPPEPKAAKPGPYFSPSFRPVFAPPRREQPQTRHEALDDVIAQMRAAAVQQAEQTQAVLLDFERMRAELHRTDIRRAWERPVDFRQESRFLPLSNAGKAIIASHGPALEAPKYAVKELDLRERAESVLVRKSQVGWEDSLEGDKDVEQSLGLVKQKFDVEESAKFSEP